MTDQLLNGFRPFGVTPILVNIQSFKNGNHTDNSTTVDAICMTKFRQINFNIVIYVVGIDMYFGNGIIGHLCDRFLLPTTMFCYYYFLDEFIKTIIIPYSLNFVNEDANTRFEITFILKPKQSFDLLRENMVNRGITAFKHDDLLVGVSRRHF